MASATSSKRGLGPEDLFLCGVVEGFYNRPWNEEQRIDLYRKMQLYGLNSYLYAPKDDHKHRALWRKPYDPAEKAALKKLMDECQEKGAHFLYGISPGLDISYSSSADIAKLKSKLDDVKALGCSGFALLWDDIDSNLSPGDRDAFSSLAEAQVKVTNEVFEHLGRPLFLTCPVEYSKNRAFPNLKESEYLNTVGAGMDPEIGIFWTGNKVVSETITKEDMIELKEVLRRKPVIWDNLHANDYDHQRIFLGPFAGRDADIIPHIAGIMTNPNCEYSLNVPAIYTMALWSRCYDHETGETREWDPRDASDRAIPHFLNEVHRDTSVCSISRKQSVAETLSEADKESMEITKEDIQLLFHVFWLPYSHGFKGEGILNEFKRLRDQAHLIKKIVQEQTSTDEEAENGGGGASGAPPCVVVESQEQELLDRWLERAARFNEVTRRFGKLCDKFTYIENRELFFDINGYLNNVHLVLMACNRYLRWAGLDHCRKPIGSGPTLAGLQGGLAGELHRLFPVGRDDEYPIRSAIPVPKEKYSFQIRPVERNQYGDLPKRCQSLWGELLCVCQSEISEQEGLENFLSQSKVSAFLTERRGRALVVEHEGYGGLDNYDDSDEAGQLEKKRAKSGGGYRPQLAGCVVGSSDVAKVVDALRKAHEEGGKLKRVETMPVTLPGPKSEIPWSLLEKSEAAVSVCFAKELLYSNCAVSSVRLMMKMLGDPATAFALVERASPLTRQFLAFRCGFSETTYRGADFCVLSYDRDVAEKQMEDD